MAFVLPSVLHTSRVQLNAPFAGFQVSQLPSLRTFRCTDNGKNAARRRDGISKCSISELGGAASSLDDFSRAQITALDNRANGEDLLRLLRVKQHGEASIDLPALRLHRVRLFRRVLHCSKMQED